MLCRTANELFWMSRHIERAENIARILDVKEALLKTGKIRERRK